MKLPIKLKSNELMVLVTIEISPDLEKVPVGDLLRPLPRSFYPIFVAYEGVYVKVYCVCTNHDDLIHTQAKTGYKTKMI